MANIEVLEQWDEGIYQLETTDPVQGGADGVDNLPHKHLANRTEWLKINKADKNGNVANKFQVANGTTESDAVNKGQLDTKANLTGSNTQKFKVANATLTDEAVNLGQLNTKINISDMQDLLTSTDVTKPLSANQGRVLKGFIDNIMAILNSDDTALDELQEIVNFIKQNKATLDALSISNIAGLSDALNNIYTKLEIDNLLSNKANLNGNSAEKFKVADAVVDDEAVNKLQMENAISISSSGFKNLLINPNFTVNQRAYVSGTATTTANQYCHDRWRVPTSGQNVTFSTINGITTVTAPASGYEQIIENINNLGGTFFLSNQGTATKAVSQSSDNVTYTTVTPNADGSYTVTGGKYIKIKFASGTIIKPQFEQGTKATIFENRSYVLEELLCKRYFEIFQSGVSAQNLTSGVGTSALSVYVTKRAVPTITFLSELYAYGTTASHTVARVTIYGCTPTLTSSTSSGNIELHCLYSASCEL